MPIEKRPKNPLPKGPRPGSLTQPHKVGDNETLELLAKKYSVSVHQLIVHNFGTTNPAEINWYLREQVGCHVPTRDHKNWRFSETAKPGLIYIPQRLMQLDPIYVTVAADPVDLGLPWPLDMLSAAKFSYGWKFPKKEPAEVGYFLLQGEFYFEGELRQQGGEVKVTVKKNQVKVAIEEEIAKDTKMVMGASFGEQQLEKIAEAVKEGSVSSFIAAVASPFDLMFRKAYRWGNFALVPEAGLEGSITPVVLRLSGEYEDFLPIEGSMFKGKFAAKAGIHIGLSRKGWAWVAEKIGVHVVKDFLFRSGERALVAIGEWLVANGLLAGGVIAGTIVGTLALTSLTAWVVQDAGRKGELRGLSTWYISAYSAKAFGLERPAGFVNGNAAMRDQLVILGEQDAVRDGRSLLVKIGDRAARGSDEEVLEAFRRALLSADNGSFASAKWRLERSLQDKARQLVGL